MFNKKNFQLLLVAVLSSLLTFAGTLWLIKVNVGDLLGFIRFQRVLGLVKRDFDGEVTYKQLYEGAMKGAVKATGDPYTVYLDKKDFANLNRMTESTFGGVGIVYGQRDGNYVIISALENNPAAKAGVKGGEIILEVDGKKTSEMNMEQVSMAIRGPKGTEVKLKLQNKDGKQWEATITRDDIKNQSVAGKLLDDTKIGYIRISMFNESTGEDFGQKYQELEGKGMEALVLDLRSNPGGTLRDGVAVSRYLVPKGPIVSIIESNGKKYTEESSLEKVKYPLVVLVNGGTASAAEIVSGAVKDTKAGHLIGTKTFGKGSVQQVYRLGRDTGLKITMAKYYTPSGVSIHNKGIEPDQVVELPENATEDNQLQAAKAYLQEQLAKKK